jgi:hypothetical protein
MAIQYANNMATAAVGAAGVAASLTANAQVGKAYFIMGLAASYDTAAGVGELTITVGATVVFRHMVHGKEVIPFPTPVVVPDNTQFVIALAGVASRVGRLSAWYALRS